MKMTEGNLIHVLIDERINNNLEEKLNIAPNYIEAAKEHRKASNKLDEMKLTKKQIKAVNRAISSAHICASEYGKVAYSQGFQDGLKLISELKKFL